MNKEELAEKLNGIQYREEIDESLLQQAKLNGLLIVTGASDDLIEFEGAFEDEGDCYAGGIVYIDANGILRKPNQDDYDDTDEGEEQFHIDYKKWHKARKNGRPIIAEWCKVPEYSWSYVTPIPHSTFDVIEDDDKYCRGIVIDIKDLL